jgi:hypothetical protein
MSKLCSTHGRCENVYKNLVGKPEGKISHGKNMSRREDNIRMNFK